MTYLPVLPIMATFSANCYGSTLNVGTMNSGTIGVGHVVLGAGLPPNSVIATLGSGAGGIGTYNLSTTPGTISSEAMTTVAATMDDAVFTALAAWISSSLGLPASSVIQVPDNRVPSPLQNYVTMARVSRFDLSMNATSDVDGNPFGVRTIEQSLEYVLQVDCFGDFASDWCTVLDVMFRSDESCAFFDPYGLAPLFNDGPTQAPFVNGEGQYELDWLLRLHFQFNPQMTLPVQFMDSAKIQLVNAGTYPLH